MKQAETLTWHEGSIPPTDGTLGLLIIRWYELYDFADYKYDRQIRHETEHVDTHIAIWINDRWQIIKRDMDDIYTLGSDDYEMEIIRWAELPAVSEGEEKIEYFRGDDADEKAEEFKNVPISIDGIKYIK